MIDTIAIALLQNAALLLAVAVVFDVASTGRRAPDSRGRQVLVGAFLGAIGIALMASSFRLQPGIIFDTRSVLLGACGLFFGTVPAIVAMVMTAAFRLWQGGAATLTGVSVILASGLLGLLWRHWRRQSLSRIGFWELYAFGWVVHLVMLALMLLLPWETARRVLAAITVPVLVIYPAATAALGTVLVNRLQREETTAALAESEARYRNLFEHSHAIMLLLDPDDGAIVDANPAASRFYGWPREQLKTMRIGQINTAPPERIRDELQRARTALAHHFFFTHRRADGSLRDVEIFSGPVNMGGRSLLHSIIHDVTERKQAEAALARSERKWREVLLRVPQIALTLDHEGRVVFANEHLLQLTGWTADEALGRDWFTTFIPPELREQIRQVFHQAMSAGPDMVVHRHENDILTRNGERRRIAWANVMLRSPQGSPLEVTCLGLDLTDRIAAEQRLRESEERYRSLFDANPHAMFIYDLETLRFLAVNDTAVARYGYSREEFLAMTLKDIRPPEDVPRLLENVATSTDVIQRSGVWRHRKKNGEILWVEVLSHAIDWQGRRARLVLAHDVTDREEARRSLEASEQRFRRAILESPFPLMLHAEDGEILQVSQSWCDLTGYAPDELRTIADWTERAYGDRKEMVRAEIRSLFNLEQRHHEGDFTVRTRDGSTRIWDFSSSPLGALPDGRRLIMSMAVDVTERREAEARIQAAREALLSVVEDQRETEAELRRSEERLRLATEAARMGTWERDLTTNRLIWSPMQEQLCGYEPGTFPGTEEAFVALLHPDCLDTYHAAHRRVREVDGIYEAELHYRLRDGRERWGLLHGRLVHDPGGRPARILGIDMDITERKQLELQRAAMEAQMRQQQRLESIGTLASGVAHEINNPITGIMNYAQIIQDRLPADSPLAEFTHEIMHETQRVATIVRNLLTFARNEKQSHSAARVSDIVEGTLSLIRTVIRKDQIALSVDVPADLPRIKCRSQQIQQVIMNLVTNARDALNERYPGQHPDKVLLLQARPHQRDGRHWVRLTVEDHGTGITPEVRERMFDPFFTTKPRDKGTGLGLAISHGIVKEHHGELLVETEPGRFTRIHLDLPVDNGWTL